VWAAADTAVVEALEGEADTTVAESEVTVHTVAVSVETHLLSDQLPSRTVEAQPSLPANSISVNIRKLPSIQD